jgi:Mn2+/Fe2+ NRAMP family transporter
VDLSGMADSAEMLTGLKSLWFVPLFGIAITAASIWCRYEQIAQILKWLALALMAYVVAGFMINPNWSQVLWSTIIPTLPKSQAMWSTLVAILGTTISPYLFYWQSSQEVEEQKSKGRKKIEDRRGATSQEIADRKLDVGSGTFASNFVMYFIILTTALTLSNSSSRASTSHLRLSRTWRRSGGSISVSQATMSGLTRRSLLTVCFDRFGGGSQCSRHEKFGFARSNRTISTLSCLHPN